MSSPCPLWESEALKRRKEAASDLSFVLNEGINIIDGDVTDSRLRSLEIDLDVLARRI